MFDELSGRDEIESDKARLDDFLELWFSPDVVARRNRVRDQMTKAD
jgi:hypothetical protein